MMLRVTFVLLAVGSAVFGQRQSSLDVIETMKSLQPIYKKLQDNVVHRLSEAKLNSSNLLYNLHTDIVETKEKFVIAAIDEEHQILTAIENQPEHVNPTCLMFVRSSANMSVNLAGVSYSNCIREVDLSLNDTLTKFNEVLNAEETMGTLPGLFDVFENENIFHDPTSLIKKLNTRMQDLTNGTWSIGNGLPVDFHMLKQRYEKCLDGGVQMLYQALDLARTQIGQICLGQLQLTTVSPTTTVESTTNLTESGSTTASTY